MEYRAELWQDGMMVACVEARQRRSVESEIFHYAFMYGQDGPVRIKIIPLPSKPKRRRAA